MKPQISTLPNGLRVATCAMPSSQTVAVGIWAAVGARHEAARVGGISHFLEHLLFKGTKKRSVRRISEEVEGVGGDLNASTQNYRLGTALLTYGKIVPPEQVYERLAKVTPEEIRKVASQVLNRRTLCLAMVGPGPSKERLFRLIRKR